MPRPPALQTILITPLFPGAVLFDYNQPKISNAFTVQQYDDLATALTWARLEPAIRVVVVGGRGKHFCAGKAMIPPGRKGTGGEGGVGVGGATIEQEIAAGGRLNAELSGPFPKVLIAAVHGAAIGWGCTQLWNFDLVYAWTGVGTATAAAATTTGKNNKRSRNSGETAHGGAVFQTPFMPLGFAPEGASSWSFPRVMGKQRANALLLAAEKLDAREMYDAGLVTKAIDADDVEGFREKVFEIAKRIATYPAESLRVTKMQVNRPAVLAEQREAGMWESVDLKERLNSEDAINAMRNFQNKRKEKTRESKL